MEQLGSNRMDFHEIWYLFIFRKFIEKVQGSLNSDKNNEFFTWRPIYILLRMKNISDKICRENQNTLFVFQLIFFLENCAVFEIMWKSTVESGRPQIAILRMRIARLIPRATNTHTHSVCVILIAFPLQYWFHESTSMLLYTHIIPPPPVNC